MNEWQKVKLGELFKIKAGGDLKKINFSKIKNDSYKFPIYSNSLENKGLYGYSDNYQYTFNCITVTGRGNVGHAEYRSEKFNAIVRLLVLIPIQTCINTKFISYYINSKLSFEHVGAAVNQLTAPLLTEKKIFLPPLETQKKIAKILSNYDDLIENNNKRIEILEQQAKTIYDEWFIQFKFPGYKNIELIESELGKIPKGWEVKKIGEILKRLKVGNKYTQDNIEEEGLIPVIDQSTKEILGFHDNEADHKATSKNPIMIFGDHTCKLQIEIKPFSVGANVIPFKSLEHSNIFIYFLIKNQVKTKEYKRHWNELIIKKVVTPSPIVSEIFVNLVLPLFENMNNLSIKNQNLRKTRDLLLPRLISGELNTKGLNIKLSEE